VILKEKTAKQAASEEKSKAIDVKSKTNDSGDDEEKELSSNNGEEVQF
jgi:hypothetical protein